MLPELLLILPGPPGGQGRAVLPGLVQEGLQLTQPWDQPHLVTLGPGNASWSFSARLWLQMSTKLTVRAVAVV